MTMKRWLLLPAVFLLASCAAMTKVGPGETVVGDGLKVKLDQGWNKFANGNGNVEVWTAEGLSLDTVRFYVKVAEGQPLEQIRGANQKQIPQFRASMEPNEIVEMFEAFSVADGSSFQLIKLAPAKFLGASGFRFDYSLVRKSDEVELRGFAYGAIRDGHLTMIVFQAPKIHFYGELALRAEALATSARLAN